MQTTSFGVSPYLLRQFGDWGTGKLGYSLNVTRSNALSGFFSSPIPTGAGIDGQTLVSNEENAHFVTGDFMAFFQNTFDVDLMQSQTTTGRTGATTVNGRAGRRPAVYTSQPRRRHRPAELRAEPQPDRVRFGRARGYHLFQCGGQSVGVAPIHDLTWSFGGHVDARSRTVR